MNPCDCCLCAHCAKYAVNKRCCQEHYELYCTLGEEAGQECPDYEPEEREENEE